VSDWQVDIAIVGGGLIGGAFLLALQQSGYRCLLIESKPLHVAKSPAIDTRALALSPASTRIFSMLNVWDSLKNHACPISEIHVSNKNQFGTTQLVANEDEALGHIVEAEYIARAIQEQLHDELILAPATVNAIDSDEGLLTVQTDNGVKRIRAQLIVAADGAHSTIRSLCGLQTSIKTYQQTAVVATVHTSLKHQNRAYERFTQEGPMALLPMAQNRMSLVLCANNYKANELMQIDNDAFLAHLQKTFGYRLGRFTQVGRRMTYPLEQRLMQQQTHGPVVFIGNAAHTIHPIAGQGFNLGLRDVAMLAQCIGGFGLTQSMMSHYSQQRTYDQKLVIETTDTLLSLFTSTIPGAHLIQNFGMVAFDNSAFLKSFLARIMQGFGGVVPDLACNIPIQFKEHP
jgi:2-octaprenyl-6-methoxyphenol hydroxylase